MLKREDAQKRLMEEQTPKWQEQQLEAISHLAPHLPPIVYALLARDEHGHLLLTNDIQAYQRQRELVDWGYNQLGTLDPAERLSIFHALFPAVAATVAAAWRMIGRLPYQEGWQRKSFRLPNQPDTSTAARRSWLEHVLHVLASYRDKDAAWFAAWMPYLAGGYLGQAFGILFAAAIDSGDDAVFDVLTASARGDHPIGAMGRHVTTGLLVASRSDGWACIERLLLAAQREEGLRQVILETVDEAHPDAFRRLLRLVLEHDLIRFSATVRAAGVWFGFPWDVDSSRAVRETLAALLPLLDGEDARHEAVAHGDAQHAYLGLWAMAFEDAAVAIAAAQPLLADQDPDRRLATAYLLGQLDLQPAQELLPPLLADPDLRVALCAFRGLQGAGEPIAHTDLFERLEALLLRLNGKAARVESGVWPWLTLDGAEQTIAGILIRCLGRRSPTALIPHLPRMSPWDRVQTAKMLAELPNWDSAVRDVLFGLVGDRSSWVREEALKLIALRPIAEPEVLPLEALLTRKSSDLRRGILSLLLKQSDAGVLAGVDRLLDARNPLQRRAALDLLAQMSAADRQVTVCQERARRYRAAHSTISVDEQTLLDAIDGAGGADHELPSLANVLGLIDPLDRTAPTPPRALRVSLDTPAARACQVLLDALAESQRTTPVTINSWHGSEEELLGNLGHRFPLPDPDLPAADDAQAHLPLVALWQQWEAKRPPAARDRDGLELIRALLLLLGTRATGVAKGAPAQEAALGTGIRVFSMDAIAAAAANPDSITTSSGMESLASSLQPIDMTHVMQGLQAHIMSFLPAGHQSMQILPVTGMASLALNQRSVVTGVLHWLIRLGNPTTASLHFLFDCAESALAAIPERALLAALEGGPGNSAYYVRHTLLQDGALSLLQLYRAWHPQIFSDAHHLRYWQLLHWMDQPLPGLSRMLPPLPVLLAAHRAGGATDADILDHLVASAAPEHGYYFRVTDFAALAGRSSHPLLDEYPVLRTLVPTLRARILELELARGEMPTPATPLALALRYSGGTALFTRLVASLPPTDLARGYTYGNQSRATVFSHLLRCTYPGPDDTSEQLAQQIVTHGITPKRLVAAAVYAPQWAGHVQRFLQWPYLEEAIWWFHAHTKDTNWSVDEDLKTIWKAEAAERTPLSGQDLLDGAVDVAWFRRAYLGLGPERWNDVYEAAKYASGGSGHARARLFADAMTGSIACAGLLSRIAGKRHQDSVRALGLVPLAAQSTEARADDLAARYAAIQEFVRTGRTFGSQRRASEATAARIGLENLARTAGYPDPIRLQWAMEAQLAADLRDGPLSVTEEGVTVILSLDPFTAEPSISATRAGRRARPAGTDEEGTAPEPGTPSTKVQGKPLKTIPPRVRKSAPVVELYERKRAIQQQVSRMRASLEGAMCRGDRFAIAELIDLLRHPVLARLLQNLLFVQDEGTTVTVLGYPLLQPDEHDPGCLFRSHDGSLRAATADVRLAHPHDLLISEAWHAWQHECFVAERIQPVKQIFRELYVLTANETRASDSAASARYSGQQVQPKQAFALFGARGWLAHPEEGVRRTFHAEGISAAVSFAGGAFTPAEVEGLTIEDVHFTRRGDWQPIPLAEVPPRLFSEVMRDLDLVVSVAHRGGVDPEASASTVEMRATLVREACALLGLQNVAIKSAHAIVEGTLGSYSVHLGSAVVHRQPGGALCIVPVHSQHRGRLFLPFADDDPRTAEVVSKIILLARDSEIKDPSILEQIL